VRLPETKVFSVFYLRFLNVFSVFFVSLCHFFLFCFIVDQADLVCFAANWLEMKIRCPLGKLQRQRTRLSKISCIQRQRTVLLLIGRWFLCVFECDSLINVNANKLRFPRGWFFKSLSPSLAPPEGQMINNTSRAANSLFSRNIPVTILRF
jgi:hypothetical protein